MKKRNLKLFFVHTWGSNNIGGLVSIDNGKKELYFDDFKPIDYQAFIYDPTSLYKSKELEGVIKAFFAFSGHSFCDEMRSIASDLTSNYQASRTYSV